MHVHLHIYICLRVYKYIDKNMYAYKYTYTYTHTYTFKYICAYVYIYYVPFHLCTLWLCSHMHRKIGYYHSILMYLYSDTWMVIYIYTCLCMINRYAGKWIERCYVIVQSPWYTYTNIHTYIYICIYIYICKYICTYINVYIYIYLTWFEMPLMKGTGVVPWSVKLAYICIYIYIYIYI
jgi:hypothetical protein